VSRWDPDLYLRHADERGRPFHDLLARIDVTPASIVDLGCGPGQLTPVLHGRWPTAWIVGVDSSPDMIAAAHAQADDVNVEYVEADVATWQPDGPVDLIVSNSLFQWVPDQLDVIGRLAAHVAPGGAFAIQVPNNPDASLHTLLHEIASRPPYVEHTTGRPGPSGTDPQAYLGLFAGLGWDVDVWETTYLHVLHGDDPVFSWISGAGARPVLQALPDELRTRFEDEYKAALREAYPPEPWGTVLPFARVFAVAQRG
jgi:trans-aconitate 2-methyltransferase